MLCFSQRVAFETTVDKILPHNGGKQNNVVIDLLLISSDGYTINASGTGLDCRAPVGDEVIHLLKRELCLQAGQRRSGDAPHVPIFLVAETKNIPSESSHSSSFTHTADESISATSRARAKPWLERCKRLAPVTPLWVQQFQSSFCRYIKCCRSISVKDGIRNRTSHDP